MVDKLEGRLGVAKEELSAASLKLSILVKTFRQSQLYLASSRAAASNATGQWSVLVASKLFLYPSHLLSLPVPSDPTRRIEIWLDDAHWSLTDSDGQLQLADINLTNFSYNRLTFSDDSGEHRLELGTFKVQNLMPNTPSIYQVSSEWGGAVGGAIVEERCAFFFVFQQVLFPYDPKDKHLRVDKNVTLRVYCKDRAPGNLLLM